MRFYIIVLTYSKLPAAIMYVPNTNRQTMSVVYVHVYLNKTIETVYHFFKRDGTDYRQVS